MPQEESVLRLGRDEALEAARLWQECGDAREFACRVLGGVMNALMDSEAQQMCGASRNERSDGRENSRNGYRPRSLKTAVGDVELEIPKLRHGTYYPEGMLARWSRVDTSVAAIVQEMYVCGVSTRKVERVASKLGISSLSSSEVSSLCSDLDAEVAEFLGLSGNTDQEKLDSLIAAIRALKREVGIKDTIRDYGIEEGKFLATLDEMVEQAFDDQCTGANPRYPLMSELKQMYLNAYSGA